MSSNSLITSTEMSTWSKWPGVTDEIIYGKVESAIALQEIDISNETIASTKVLVDNYLMETFYSLHSLLYVHPKPVTADESEEADEDEDVSPAGWNTTLTPSSLQSILDKVRKAVVDHVTNLLDDRLVQDRSYLLNRKNKILNQLQETRKFTDVHRKVFEVKEHARHSEVQRLTRLEFDEKIKLETEMLTSQLSSMKITCDVLTQQYTESAARIRSLESELLLSRAQEEHHHSSKSKKKKFKHHKKTPRTSRISSASSRASHDDRSPGTGTGTGTGTPTDTDYDSDTARDTERDTYRGDTSRPCPTCATLKASVIELNEQVKRLMESASVDALNAPLSRSGSIDKHLDTFLQKQPSSSSSPQSQSAILANRAKSAGDVHTRTSSGRSRLSSLTDPSFGQQEVRFASIMEVDDEKRSSTQELAAPAPASVSLSASKSSKEEHGTTAGGAVAATAARSRDSSSLNTPAFSSSAAVPPAPTGNAIIAPLDNPPDNHDDADSAASDSNNSISSPPRVRGRTPRREDDFPSRGSFSDSLSRSPNRKKNSNSRGQSFNQSKLTPLSTALEDDTEGASDGLRTPGSLISVAAVSASLAMADASADAINSSTNNDTSAAAQEGVHGTGTGTSSGTNNAQNQLSEEELQQKYNNHGSLGGDRRSSSTVAVITTADNLKDVVGPPASSETNIKPGASRNSQRNSVGSIEKAQRKKRSSFDTKPSPMQQRQQGLAAGGAAGDSSNKPSSAPQTNNQQQQQQGKNNSNTSSSSKPMIMSNNKISVSVNGVSRVVSSAPTRLPALRVADDSDADAADNIELLSAHRPEKAFKDGSAMMPSPFGLVLSPEPTDGGRGALKHGDDSMSGGGSTVGGGGEEGGEGGEGGGDGSSSLGYLRTLGHIATLRNKVGSPDILHLASTNGGMSDRSSKAAAGRNTASSAMQQKKKSGRLTIPAAFTDWGPDSEDYDLDDSSPVKKAVTPKSRKRGAGGTATKQERRGRKSSAVPSARLDRNRSTTRSRSPSPLSDRRTVEIPTVVVLRSAGERRTPASATRSSKAVRMLDRSIQTDASYLDEVKKYRLACEEALHMYEESIEVQNELRTKILTLEYQNAKLSKKIRTDELMMEKNENLHILQLKERKLLLMELTDQLIEVRALLAREQRIRSRMVEGQGTTLNPAVRQLYRQPSFTPTKKELPVALPLIKFDPNEEIDTSAALHTPHRFNNNNNNNHNNAHLATSTSVDASSMHRMASTQHVNRSASQPIFRSSPVGRASTAALPSRPTHTPTPSASGGGGGGGVVAALKKVVQDHSYVDRGPGQLLLPGTAAHSPFGPRHAALLPGGHEGVVDVDIVDNVVDHDTSGGTDYGFNPERMMELNEIRRQILTVLSEQTLSKAQESKKGGPYMATAKAAEEKLKDRQVKLKPPPLALDAILKQQLKKKKS